MKKIIITEFDGTKLECNSFDQVIIYLISFGHAGLYPLVIQVCDFIIDDVNDIKLLAQKVIKRETVGSVEDAIKYIQEYKEIERMGDSECQENQE